MTTTRRTRWRSHSDPVWRDERNRIAGEVLAMCARTQKAVALALDNSEGWISRLVHGDPSVGTHLERVEALAAFGGTEAGPLAAAPFAAMNRVYAEQFDDRDLEVALRVALQHETDSEGPENSAQARCLLERGLGPDEQADLEEELARRFVRSMAWEAVCLGLLWERRRRRLRTRAH